MEGSRTGCPASTSKHIVIVDINLRIADYNGEKIDNTNILHSANGVNNKKYLRCANKGIAIIAIELKELKEDKPRRIVK